jgi:hypothetical protein
MAALNDSMEEFVSANDPFNGNPYNVDDLFPVQYDASQRAMLALHPWMLLFASVILTIGGIWGGIVAPIMRRLQVRRFTKGYSHSSHITTVILSA